MNAHPEACDPSRVEAYLSESMPREDEAAFLAHLGSCSSCRQRLQQLAAKPSTWSDAEDFLRDRHLDSGGCRTSNAFSRHDELLDGSEMTSGEVAQVLSLLNPTDDPEMLGRLGGYEVSGVIGSGGMGIVLKAFDGPLDRTVAIKVLAPRLASSGAARRRFGREAKAAATVLHPNVIVIHSVSNEGKLPFLVMPCIRGESLQRRLDRNGPLQTEEILRIGHQIASGLAAAHQQGLVHRDIKPANILLEDGVERVTLTDFGLARAVDDASMTRSGVIAGTPQYMSPEQARGENVDSRSDLFSLGSVVYAMCTGHPPFRADTSYGILRRITDTEPRPIREINPNIPEWLEQIVRRLLAKVPAQRMQTADDVAELFQKCVAHVQQPMIIELPEECRPNVRSSRWKFASMSPVRAGIFALLAGLVLAGIRWGGRPFFENGTSTKDNVEVPARDQHPSNTADSGSAVTEWEAGQNEIEDMDKELRQSEKAAGELWGVELRLRPP